MFRVPGLSSPIQEKCAPGGNRSARDSRIKERKLLGNGIPRAVSARVISAAVGAGVVSPRLGWFRLKNFGGYLPKPVARAPLGVGDLEALRRYFFALIDWDQGQRLILDLVDGGNHLADAAFLSGWARSNRGLKLTRSCSRPQLERGLKPEVCVPIKVE